MISIKIIRENPQSVQDFLNLKGYEGSITKIHSLDENYRKVNKKLEDYRAQKNKVSEQVAVLKRDGKDSNDQIVEMRKLGEKVKVLEGKLSKVKKELNSKLDEIPNLPHFSVPKGKDEKDNVVVREWGDKKFFDFAEKTHLELSKELGLIDLERGAKISGSGFPIYTGKGAKLERSLINSMIDHHIDQYAFTEIFPSVLILEESMRTTGQLPKFKEDMYLSELDNLYLAPTAEVPITNMHRQEIIPESELPINYVAYSPCFRRESGSYGKDTRGLLRHICYWNLGCGS